jgi:hypothetical protein
MRQLLSMQLLHPPPPTPTLLTSTITASFSPALRNAVSMSIQNNKSDVCRGQDYIPPSSDKDLTVQLVLSLALGVTAFFAFCVRLPLYISTSCPPTVRLI